MGRPNTTVTRLPVAAERPLAVDDDIDLGGSVSHGQSDLLQSGLQRELARGEPGGHWRQIQAQVGLGWVAISAHRYQQDSTD